MDFVILEMGAGRHSRPRLRKPEFVMLLLGLYITGLSYIVVGAGF